MASVHTTVTFQSFNGLERGMVDACFFVHIPKRRRGSLCPGLKGMHVYFRWPRMPEAIMGFHHLRERFARSLKTRNPSFCGLDASCLFLFLLLLLFLLFLLLCSVMNLHIPCHKYICKTNYHKLKKQYKKLFAVFITLHVQCEQDKVIGV